MPASDSSSDESGIDLVPPEQGKYKLTQQHSRVRRVVDRAIDLTLIEIALKNAFPDGPQKNNQIVYRALLHAAEEFDYTDIFKRVKKKDNYMVELSRLVCTTQLATPIPRTTDDILTGFSADLDIP